MSRFAANLSLLFTELPYLDRFDAAAQAGFTGAEVLFPYDVSVRDTQRALRASGLDFALMNAPPPNYAGGAPGYAAMPGGEARFAHDIRRVLRYAAELRPDCIHVMAGYATGPAAEAALVGNLRAAADLAPGQTFTIEPLNQTDQPGYALSDFDIAMELLARTDRPNVALQFDSYHAQVIHGDALAVWQRVRERVAHVQIGDAPGRAEPGKGGIDFAALFAAIGESGYAGWISAEYHPSTARTEASLGWLPA